MPEKVEWPYELLSANRCRLLIYVVPHFMRRKQYFVQSRETMNGVAIMIAEQIAVDQE